MDKELGELEPVELEEYWKNENDFTEWLAKNIVRLCDKLGFDEPNQGIKSQDSVGHYKPDIVGRYVDALPLIIENQFGRSDHKHLGQILTYGAGLDASIVVWIAEEFNDEHRAALDWLNERTGEKTGFYGVELQLLKIKDSPAALVFNVVSKPNEFSKAIKDPTAGPEKLLWYEFRSELRDYLSGRSENLKPKEPSIRDVGKKWGIAAFRVGWGLCLGLDSGRLSVFIHLEGKFAVAAFSGLKDQEAEINRELQNQFKDIGQLQWKQPSGIPHHYGGAGRISVERDADLEDREKWPEYFEWLRIRLETFYNVFGPRLKKIADSLTAEED